MICRVVLTGCEPVLVGRWMLLWISAGKVDGRLDPEAELLKGA